MEKNTFLVSKEKFVDIMARYRETLDITYAICDLYEKNERLFITGGAALPSLVDDLLDLLNIIFDLEEDDQGNTVLEYWIREQDFGRRESDNYEFNLYGTKLPVGCTAEDIYDLICWAKSRLVL